MRIIHAEGIQIIIGDLCYELEELEITLGLQQFQHQGIVKVGHVYGMMDKIKLKEWTDRLTKLLFKVLKFKSLISLQAKKRTMAHIAK